MHLQLFLHNFLQLDDVSGEPTDTRREFFRSHGILIDHPTKGLFIHINLRDVHISRLGGIQLELNLVGRSRKLVQQCGGNRQTVATSQLDNLTAVAERGSHDYGVVAVLLVVVIDLRHGNDSRILSGGKSIDFLVGFVPVHDTTNKGGNQCRSGLSTCDGLRLVEDEGHVAGDSFLFQDFRGLDALPRGSDLDQNPGLVHSDFFV